MDDFISLADAFRMLLRADYPQRDLAPLVASYPFRLPPETALFLDSKWWDSKDKLVAAMEAHRKLSVRAESC